MLTSIYTKLSTLILVCVEILRLLKLGKAVPWKRMPWILSPTAIIVKTSPFDLSDGKVVKHVLEVTFGHKVILTH